MDQSAPQLAFVVVPQWQGSDSARALRLVDGALAIAGDLPSRATVVVDVPAEAGDALGTPVHRLSAIQEVAARHREALAAAPGIPVTIGGDCGVALGAVSHSIAHADDVAVVWFDAHPDLNTPDSSASGAFAGMVLRTLLGDGHASLVPATPLAPGRVVLAGARSFDPEEVEAIERLGITVVAPPAFGDQDAVAAWPAAVAARVAATGASRVHVHVDVDVHDPADFSAKSTPVPFGVPAAAVVGAVRAVLEQTELAGASIAEFAPASPDDVAGDLATILRLIGALLSGTHR